MHELLRPVWVRDIPINIFGRLRESDVPDGIESADRSPYAGYGMIAAKRTLDKYIAEEKAGRQ